MSILDVEDLGVVVGVAATFSVDMEKDGVLAVVKLDGGRIGTASKPSMLADVVGTSKTFSAAMLRVVLGVDEEVDTKASVELTAASVV